MRLRRLSTASLLRQLVDLFDGGGREGQERAGEGKHDEQDEEANSLARCQADGQEVRRRR